MKHYLPDLNASNGWRQPNGTVWFSYASLAWLRRESRDRVAIIATDEEVFNLGGRRFWDRSGEMCW